jgi:hypothetical protein
MCFIKNTIFNQRTSFKALVLLVLFVLLISTKIKAQLTYKKFDQFYDITLLKQDVDFVKHKLEELHPNLYLFITKPALDSKFDSLKSTLKQPQTLAQFQYKLACALGSIGDGHLALSFYIDNNEAAEAIRNATKAYPIQQLDFKIFNKKIYIVKNRTLDKTVPIGAEVIAINKLPASQVVDQLTQCISSDGYNKTLKYLLLTNSRLPYIFTQVYGLLDTLSLIVKKDSIVRKIILTSLPFHQQRENIQPINTAEFKTPQNAPAYLKPGTFEREGLFEGMMKNRLDPFKDDYTDFFERAKKNKSTCLILDLRDNAGGDYSIVTKIFSYLIKQPAYFASVPSDILNDVKKTPDPALKLGISSPIKPDVNSFQGNIYILINAGSFSATTLLAANLQAMKRATFIGEETGGGRDGCTGGSFQIIRLKNTPLILTFGNIPFKISKPGMFKGRGIIPDVTIKYTVEDFLLHKDLEMDWLNSQLNKIH